MTKTEGLTTRILNGWVSADSMEVGDGRLPISPEVGKVGFTGGRVLMGCGAVVNESMKFDPESTGAVTLKVESRVGNVETD